ncbi:hypothetical protein CWI38_2420p0020 [Hamiltosporidium tvaerminnensis]|uniref:Uncharacterized protein n=1 Tax=Hamiltosporidium tvaerminnensis TaxID=1176355 RepID=A0A4Q9LJ46_9MICR|nr:hypothetical protein CWI38_2420p0020 [Hamiltosporidium tvaerminnensis]
MLEGVRGLEGEWGVLVVGICGRVLVYRICGRVLVVGICGRVWRVLLIRVVDKSIKRVLGDWRVERWRRLEGFGDSRDVLEGVSDSRDVLEGVSVCTYK